MDEVQLDTLLHYEDVIRLQAQTSLVAAGQSVDRFTQLARMIFDTLRCVSGFSLLKSFDLHLIDMSLGCIVVRVLL